MDVGFDEAVGSARAGLGADVAPRGAVAPTRDVAMAASDAILSERALSRSPRRASRTECDAESFSTKILRGEVPLSASTVLQVFELLPSQPLPRGIPLNDAKSFSLGAYSVCGLVHFCFAV